VAFGFKVAPSVRVTCGLTVTVRAVPSLTPQCCGAFVALCSCSFVSPAATIV
jgi:hypothetical protein